MFYCVVSNSLYCRVYLFTVDGERFVGLNICSFSAIKVFTEIFLHISAHYLVQLKRGTYIHGKSFAVLLKIVKNVKV